MRRTHVLAFALTLSLGCTATTPSNVEGGPGSGCGAVPAGGLPVCDTCILCGPMVNPSGGAPGCTDGTTRGCWSCRSNAWVTLLIGGCADSNDAGGTPQDAAIVDAAMSSDAGADANVDANVDAH